MSGQCEAIVGASQIRFCRFERKKRDFPILFSEGGEDSVCVAAMEEGIRQKSCIKEFLPPGRSCPVALFFRGSMSATELEKWLAEFDSGQNGSLQDNVQII